MSHIQQQNYCHKIKMAMSFFFQDKIVVDIGCLDINGSNNCLFSNCLYIGIDIGEGKNVDFITKGHELGLPDNSVDTVVSTECFEHDQYYELTLRNIYRILKPGGLFIFTCATTGRAEHGTRSTRPEDAPLLNEDDGWSDYYKNLTEFDIRKVFDIENQFSSFQFEVNNDSCDLYFWGIKSGEYKVRTDYSFLVNNKYLEQINQLKTELQNQNQGISELKQNIMNNEQTLVKINNQIIEKDQQLLIMLNSRSWKLTKPLRYVARFLRSYCYKK